MRSTEPRKRIVPLPDRSSSSERSGTLNAVLPRESDGSVAGRGTDGMDRRPKEPPDGTGTVVAQPITKMESSQELGEKSSNCASHDNGCIISTQTSAPATVLVTGPIPVQSRSRNGASRRIWDLKSAQRITVASGGQTQVDTGLALSVRPSAALIVYGTEANSLRGLFMQPLLIDHSRRLPIKLTIHNHSDRDVTISHGQILARCVCTHLGEAQFLMSTEMVIDSNQSITISVADSIDKTYIIECDVMIGPQVQQSGAAVIGSVMSVSPLPLDSMEEPDTTAETIDTNTEDSVLVVEEADFELGEAAAAVANQLVTSQEDTDLAELYKDREYLRRLSPYLRSAMKEALSPIILEVLQNRFAEIKLDSWFSAVMKTIQEDWDKSMESLATPRLEKFFESAAVEKWMTCLNL